MMLLNGALRLSLLVTVFAGRTLGGPFPQNHDGRPMSDAGKNGAVASEANECTKAGKMMFAAGGNAVDAIVATTFCVGVVAGYHSGIGGGGFMLVRGTDGVYEAIDFRETAPGLATENMFENNVNASIFGGLAVAVPGEVKGLYYAHRKYGRLSWPLVMADAIHIAKGGFKVSHDMDHYYSKTVTGTSNNFLAEDAEWAKDYRVRGQLAGIGKKMTRLRLANTLQAIADKGPDEFYSGQLAKDMVKSIRNAGGIITLDDFKNYQVKTRPVVKMQYSTYGFESLDDKVYDDLNKKKNQKLLEKNPKAKLDPKPTEPFEAGRVEEKFALYGIGAPASGSIVFAILRVMDNFAREWATKQATKENKNRKNKDARKFTHHYVEAMKFAYAMRMRLGDPDFVDGMEEIQKTIISNDTAWRIHKKIDPKGTLPLKEYDPEGVYLNEDHGTSQIAAADRDGLAVSLTTTVNLLWGSRIVCPKTGVIFNNEMNDFSIPGVHNEFGFEPSKSNFIRGGKRPLSSITPIIIEHIIDNKPNVFFAALGAAGGSRIISATAQTLFHMMHDANPLRQAIGNPRLHDQLIPQTLLVEKNFPSRIVEYLKDLNHNITWVPEGLSAVHGVSQDLKTKDFTAIGDPRQRNSAGLTY